VADVLALAWQPVGLSCSLLRDHLTRCAISVGRASISPVHGAPWGGEEV
jgi:hypothetical protein